MDETDKAQRDAQALQHDLEQAGWKWQGNGIDRMLVNPSNPELNIWFHPYTGESLLSPMLVEWLKRSVQQAGGERDHSSSGNA